MERRSTLFSAEQEPFQMNFRKVQPPARQIVYASSPVLANPGSPKELLLLLHTDNTFHYGTPKQCAGGQSEIAVEMLKQKNQLLIIGQKAGEFCRL